MEELKKSIKKHELVKFTKKRLIEEPKPGLGRLVRNVKDIADGGLGKLYGEIKDANKSNKNLDAKIRELSQVKFKKQTGGKRYWNPKNESRTDNKTWNKILKETKDKYK